MTSPYLLRPLRSLEQAQADQAFKFANRRDSPEVFAKLTRHLQINGQPMESVLHRLIEEKKSD